MIQHWSISKKVKKNKSATLSRFYDLKLLSKKDYWFIRVPIEMQWQRSFRNLDVLEEGGVFQSTNILVITFMIQCT